MNSLRGRLVLFVTGMLVAVCTTMAAATVLVQRANLYATLDQRVRDAADRSQGGLQRRTGDATDLGFLNERGQPAGTVAARLTAGKVVAAEVVTGDGQQTVLRAAQRAALTGITADGTLHTRTIPGLGTYRLTAASGDGPGVLAGLPTTGVEDTLHDLIVTEAVIASAGLVVAGGVSAVVIRRRLRPLRRVAGVAAEVARAPLDRGEVSGLPRVVEVADKGEVGQVGAALNRLIDRVESSLGERQRSEDRMRRFLADASHELRTPLASIAGYAELMDQGVTALEPGLAWRRVSAQSARMTGLVEDLLLLARLDEGRPLERAEVNLATLVAEAVWDARAAGGSHEWGLALRLAEPAVVVGDAGRLTQVVVNLLANARAHTPGGTRVEVVVEAGAGAGSGGGGCLVVVRDDGPGIPGELLPNVFERFTREGASRSRGVGGGGELGGGVGLGGGAGLGLAIASAIVGAHGGSIGVESEPGRTEFRVWLPFAGDSQLPSGEPQLDASGWGSTGR
ncbi:HAMP domain-containing sensor histidine kinase [Streptomyces sp. NPDC004539]|uniref:sensor histidine kinase n=1 Tax=Streptomyces sp. NPDC004539 TaxID=3154280 RepID=UPI0033AA859C